MLHEARREREGGRETDQCQPTRWKREGREGRGGGARTNVRRLRPHLAFLHTSILNISNTNGGGFFFLALGDRDDGSGLEWARPRSETATFGSTLR